MRRRSADKRNNKQQRNGASFQRQRITPLCLLVSIIFIKTFGSFESVIMLVVGQQRVLLRFAKNCHRIEQMLCKLYDRGIWKLPIMSLIYVSVCTYSEVRTYIYVWIS
jgi:hypothetical protein